MRKKLHLKGHLTRSSWKTLIKRGATRLGFHSKNKRHFPRFDCTIPVEIHLDTPGQVSVINAVAQNISSGGMLIKCSTILDALTSCHVSFKVPEWFPNANRTRDIMANALIRHANPSDMTFGLAFTQPV